MNWLESILIIAGISLDIFATMDIEGARLAQVKRKSLLIACGLVLLLQLIFFFGGYFGCYYIYAAVSPVSAVEIGNVVAVIVFGMLGLRLIVKAIKREFIHEKRAEDIVVSKYIRIVIVTSFYTLVAGCACGLVGTTVWFMVLVIAICSVLSVVGGIYIGYYFGFEAKTVVYVIGAILLWIAGAEVLLRNVIHLFS